MINELSETFSKAVIVPYVLLCTQIHVRTHECANAHARMHVCTHA